MEIRAVMEPPPSASLIRQERVVSVARRYVGRGQELEDLIQIGLIGLVKAIDRFDMDYANFKRRCIAGISAPADAWYDCRHI